MGKRRRGAGGGGVSFFAFQDIITSVVGIFVLITLIMVLELAQTVSEAKASSAPRVSAGLLASLEALQQEVESLQAERDKLNQNASNSADTNSFNLEEQIEQLEAQLKQTNDRIVRSNQLTKENQQSLVEAERINEQMIAESRAAESERNELEDLQDQRREVERYSSVLEIDRPLIFRDTTQENRWLVLVQVTSAGISVSDSTDATNRDFTGWGRVAEFKKWLVSRDLSIRHFLVILKPSGVDDFKELVKVLKDAGATFGYDVAEEDASYVLRSEMEYGQ